jgi:preprotein translocase subunit SecF
VNFKKLNYVKPRKYFFAFSATVQILGLIMLLVFGLNLGVDFQSGTRLDINIAKPFTGAEVGSEMKSLGLTPGTIELVGNKNERVAVRFKQPLTKEQVASVKDDFTKKYGKQVDIIESTVDPTISRELAKQAIYAILLASLGIIIYVTIRFEYRFAITGIIALLHDAFGIVAVFSLFEIEVDLTFIAAVLTIVGYSIYDTIVIFDRIRENLRKTKIKKVEDYEHVVNISIQETITRSINTVLTVAFAALCLLLFGGESIRNFSLAMMIGLIFGAYSSIFIASQLWLLWRQKDFKKQRVVAKNNEAS